MILIGPCDRRSAWFSNVDHTLYLDNTIEDGFNALPDNPSKLVYIRETMDADEKDRKKSLCLE